MQIGVRIGSMLVLTLLASISLVSIQSPASAWTPLGCTWGSTNIRYFVNSNVNPATNFQGAASDWNSVTPINLIKVDTASQRNFTVRSRNLGNTGWSGAWHRQGNANVGVACKANGHWVNQTGVISVNSFFHSGSGPKRRGVAAHEFGHALGLHHETNSHSCNGNGLRVAALMYPYDTRFNGNCAVFKPTSDDRSGINALY